MGQFDSSNLDCIFKAMDVKEIIGVIRGKHIYVAGNCYMVNNANNANGEQPNVIVTLN